MQSGRNRTAKLSISVIPQPLGKKQLAGTTGSPPIFRESNIAGKEEFSHLAPNESGFAYRDPWKTKARSIVWILDRSTALGNAALGKLEREGFRIRSISMSSDVIQHVMQITPSLVVIETTASNEAAHEVCRGIRRLYWLSKTPVVFLSDSASENDRICGLESGADDFISDSPSPREIAARLRAVIRRFLRQEMDSQTSQAPDQNLYSLLDLARNVKTGDIQIDADAMTVSVRGSMIVTTNLEFRLLYYLLQNQGRVFSRDQLLTAVWTAEFVESRSVDACIRRLRRKIEPKPTNPIYLRTVRGAGYCLHAGSA